jgi:hypothetical protein
MMVLLRANEQEDHSQHDAAAASRFLPVARYAADADGGRAAGIKPVGHRRAGGIMSR